MSVLVLFEMVAQADGVDAVKAKLEEILVDTRAFEGCEGVLVWQDEDEPTTIILEETWASRHHSDVYSEWRGTRLEEDGLRTLLAEPPRKRHFDLLAV